MTFASSESAGGADSSSGMGLVSLTVALIGCGKMGGAMARGWLANGLSADRLFVVDPAATDVPDGVARTDAAALSAQAQVPDIIVLAVKPQGMADTLPAYRTLAERGSVFLSVAAGKTIDGLTAGLGGTAAVVRAMPNTPAAVGRGASVLCANARVPADRRAACEALMAAVGSVHWVDDEALMDAVTAVSGSGPAYVFWLVEAMAAAGEKAGLPADLAAALARQTVVGAGALMAGSPETADTLRRNVTSPGGTTAAALSVLMAETTGLGPLMAEAVDAAARRSRELAG